MSDNDFKKLVGDVRPVKSSRSSPDFSQLSASNIAQKDIQRQKRERASFSTLDSDNSSMVLSEELISFIKPGYPNKILKKLKQEKYPVVLEVDLHYMTEVDAKNYLLKSLASIHCLYTASFRIIHGKSLLPENVNNYPVLKNMVVQTLSSHSNVIAYASCLLSNGGAGATLALIKSI